MAKDNIHLDEIWHDVTKELPPYDTVVCAIMSFNNLHGLNYGITDAIRPSPENRDPHAYYDSYGFEELISAPIAWAYKPEFPKWVITKLNNKQKEWKHKN